MSLMNDNGILKTAIGTYYNYVDVNNDQNLRKMMVKYYQDKTLKWLKKDYIEITNCFEATSDGKLIRVIANEGEELPVGHLIGLMSDEDVDEVEIENFISNFTPPTFD